MESGKTASPSRSGARTMSGKQLPFEEYLNDPDPKKRELAANWRTAIGLQSVDRLTVSDKLIELARRNIEGELTAAEVEERLNTAQGDTNDGLDKDKQIPEPDPSP